MKLNSIFTNNKDQLVIDPIFLIKNILKQKTFILKFTALFSLITFTYAFSKKPYYKGIQTFIFEEKSFFLKDEISHIKVIAKSFWDNSNIVKYDISNSINANREIPISYFSKINSDSVNNKVIFRNQAFTKENVERDAKLIRNEFVKHIYSNFDKKEEEINSIKESSKENLTKSIIKTNNFLNNKGIAENIDLKYLDKVRYELNLKIIDNINNNITEIENINKDIFRQKKSPEIPSKELVKYNLLKNELDSNLIDNYVIERKYREFINYKQKTILDLHSNNSFIINEVSPPKLKIILSYTFVGLIISSLIVFFREFKNNPKIFYN